MTKLTWLLAFSLLAARLTGNEPQNPTDPAPLQEGLDRARWAAAYNTPDATAALLLDAFARAHLTTESPLQVDSVSDMESAVETATGRATYIYTARFHTGPVLFKAFIVLEPTTGRKRVWTALKGAR